MDANRLNSIWLTYQLIFSLCLFFNSMLYILQKKCKCHLPKSWDMVYPNVNNYMRNVGFYRCWCVNICCILEFFIVLLKGRPCVMVLPEDRGFNRPFMIDIKKASIIWKLKFCGRWETRTPDPLGVSEVLWTNWANRPKRIANIDCWYVSCKKWGSFFCDFYINILIDSKSIRYVELLLRFFSLRCPIHDYGHIKKE